MRLFGVLLAIIMSASVWSIQEAAAQSRGPGAPGVFDFYVLSLSWSPTHCLTNDDDRSQQCSGRRPYSFIVHGLWPQYDRGWPEYCSGGGDQRVKRNTINKMMPIMPSVGLIRHQWNKHGTCSGLGEDLYFDKVLDARDVVTIPPAFAGIDETVMVAPELVEKAFRTANPGISADAIHVTCDRRYLREVRICMTKALDYMSCPELEGRTCRLQSAVMPPVR